MYNLIWPYARLGKERRQKGIFFSVPATKRGGGYLATKTFLWGSRTKNPKNVVATKLEGGGGKALVASQLKKAFFAASLSFLPSNSGLQICTEKLYKSNIFV